MTQGAVAEAMGVSQPRVAKLESDALAEADPQLSTLARYVAALGGELEVRARFADRSVRLMGPPQALPPTVPVEVSAETEAEAKATMATVEQDDTVK